MGARVRISLQAEDAAETLRRSGIENVSAADLAHLRQEMAKVSDRERVRLRYTFGDGLAETAIDQVWVMLDRRPTAGEYEALAVLFEEAATYCRRDAAKERKRPTG